MISQEYLIGKKAQVYEEITLLLSEMPEDLDIEDYPDDEIEDPVVEEPNTDETTQSNPSTNINYDLTETTSDFSLSKKYYVGKIVIPKINLAKGFTAMESSLNTIEKNVAIISPSNYPDVENGMFILAAHAGNMWKSFFKNLYQLNVGDVAYIFYNNVKYEYKIVNIYNQERGSMLKIYRNSDKATLVLVTCSKFDKTKQVIYILERD